MKRWIIGVSGLAGSGKSTVAEILTDCRFVTLSLADPIKRLAQGIYAFSNEQLWGPSHHRNEPDPRYRRSDGSFLSSREALQRLGAAGRACHADTWIAHCLNQAQEILTATSTQLELFDRDPAQPRGVVIPDIRFENEVAAIRRAGGILIRIQRPGAGLKGAAGQHESEREQVLIPDSAFDCIIDNSGTLEDLRRQVLAVLERL